MKKDGIFEEAGSLVEEEKTEYREKMRLLIKNWATIASASVIILSYMQYTYKYGICMAFKLPISAVIIKLTDYIPAVALLCGIALYIVDCYVSLNPQSIKGKSNFSFFRVIWGTAIIFIALFLAFKDDIRNLLWIALVSVLPPLMIEAILAGSVRARLKAAVKKSIHKKLTDETENRPLYQYFIKPVLIIVVVLILLIPFISKIIAENRKVYEICNIEEKNYAVILDHSNDVIVLPAEIDSGSMTIYTGSYKYVSRTDANEFVFREFDQVDIIDGSNQMSE